MPALTPEFLFDLESNMRVIQEDEFARLASNLRWSEVMKVIPSGSKKEIVTWLLSTARIETLGKTGGNIPFHDLVTTYTTFEPEFAGGGLRLSRPNFEDLDGNGVKAAEKWSRDMGALSAYWPQKLMFKALKEGHLATSVGYDGQPFFGANPASAHPVNPFKPEFGYYANLFTGGASGSYPGACPIDDSVTLDVALQNYSKLAAYIESIRMPNGEDPRMLYPELIIAPPRMKARVKQLTTAKYIAQAAATGGGGADVEAVVKGFGFAEPWIAQELAGYENDTTFFLVCRELASSELGALVFIEREPFRTNYYTGQGGGTGVDAILNRTDELEWHNKGRNGVGYGHPYLIFKCKGS
jgi:hypothetical protein